MKALLQLRWGGRAALVAVAVIGSALYGASLAGVVPGWTLGSAALWLALSAGLAWCVLIPVLVRTTRLAWWEVVDACLITMAGGEIVLGMGALVNVLLAGWQLLAHGALINALIVAISNITMAVILARILARAGVPARRTLCWWTVALNGSGAIFFWSFYRWLYP